ncbi:3-deoxy-7-phosphoheptulonate synthase [Mitsuaria sp. WAJ17]|uniref:3-deoxy-7-phosphoheptulonate synthase n=1 Tax=Mitsuaria sp. WAJ17 TaxID=2761452 RepID=UPI0016000F34|nr:3-deoxy-7-phosphoheptulonate synthase [Mitsuaria sp. WAJ17]MBB2485945.1 3-deoxy-7-phosphoheptulonate synthase [Mitsuaria sp. WAJ17]
MDTRFSPEVAARHARPAQALPSPLQLMQQTDAPGRDVLDLVGRTRARIRLLMQGRDDRLLVLIGPCSIHDPRSALDYARRLAQERERLGDELELVMRVYFEKPRTTLGWKGMIQDPWLDGSGQFQEGLFLARQLLLDINRLGVPAATEFLDPLVAPYLEDLVSWGAVGARTTESQTHREMASGLPLPVGFKNGTDGNVQTACDAIEAASAPHHRLGLDPGGHVVVQHTAGNPDGHLVLRGGLEPNYHAQPVSDACETLKVRGLPPRLVVDCSHGNSRKQHEQQRLVAADIAARIQRGERKVFGLMIESHLKAGRQPFVPGVHAPDALVYGQSITDACLDWPGSLQVLQGLQDAVRARRRRMALSNPVDSTGGEPDGNSMQG